MSSILEPLVSPDNFEVLNTTGKEIKAKSAWFQWDAVNTSPEKLRGEFRGYKVSFVVLIGKWELREPVLLFCFFFFLHYIFLLYI